MTYSALFAQLVRAEIELWDSLNASLMDQLGVTLPTLHALTAIETLQHPVRVQDISIEMSITVGATSKVVDRLERAGLVERRHNPDDRRSSVITITAAGERTLGEARTAAEKHWEAILSHAYTKTQALEMSKQLSSLRSLVSERDK